MDQQQQQQQQQQAAAAAASSSSVLDLSLLDAHCATAVLALQCTA